MNKRSRKLRARRINNKKYSKLEKNERRKIYGGANLKEYQEYQEWLKGVRSNLEEKNRTLIDITNDNLLENYFKVRKELFKYSNKLIRKNEIIVFNKIDMISNDEINEKIDVFNKKIKKKIYTISALKHKGLKTIKKILISHAH